MPRHFAPHHPKVATGSPAVANIGTPAQTTGATLTLTFPATTAGNILVAAIADAGDGTVAPTGWTLDKSATAQTGIYMLQHTCKAGETSQAFTVSGTVTSVGITYELSGVDGLDVSIATEANISSLPTPPTLQFSSQLTPTAEPYIAIAAASIGGTNATGGSWDSGFTTDVNMDTLVGGSATHVFCAGHIVESSTTSLQPTLSWTTPHSASMVMCYFKKGGSAGTPASGITKVQGAVNSKTTSLGTITGTLTTAATVNNLLIATVNGFGTSWATPTGWTAGPHDNTFGNIAVFYKVAAGGETSVSVVETGAVTSQEIEIEEWSGFNGAPTLDLTTSAHTAGAGNITLVGVGAMVAGTSTLTPSLPAGVQSGDIIIACSAAYNTTTATWSATGYTARTNQTCGSTTAGRVGTIYKIAGSSESNPTITCSAPNNGWATFLVVFRGVDNTTPFDVADVASDSFGGVNSVTPTGLTTVTNGAVAVSLLACTNNETLTITTSQSFTTDASGSSYHHHPTPDCGLALTHKTISTAGAVTMPTYNGPTDFPSQWGAISMALRPAATGGATSLALSPGTTAVAAELVKTAINSGGRTASNAAWTNGINVDDQFSAFTADVNALATGSLVTSVVTNFTTTTASWTSSSSTCGTFVSFKGANDSNTTPPPPPTSGAGNMARLTAGVLVTNQTTHSAGSTDYCLDIGPWCTFQGTGDNPLPYFEINLDTSSPNIAAGNVWMLANDSRGNFSPAGTVPGSGMKCPKLVIGLPAAWGTGFSCTQVAQGAADSYLGQMAGYLKQINPPEVTFRVGWETDATWAAWAWVSDGSTTAQKQQNYQAAVRHIVAFFKAQGIKNVLFEYNGFDGNKGDSIQTIVNRALPWIPFDAIDILGCDPYDRGGAASGTGPQAADQINQIKACQQTAAANGKLFGIGEVGWQENNGTAATNFLQLLDSFPSSGAGALHHWILFQSEPGDYPGFPYCLENWPAVQAVVIARLNKP